MLLNQSNFIAERSTTPTSISHPPLACPTPPPTNARRKYPNKPVTLAPTVDHGCEINGTTIDCIPKDSKFYQLIMDLKQLLAGKGLSNEDIDVEKVKQLMADYDSNEIDWQHMALHDPSRNYSRNGIINLNGNANLLILVWSPGKSSAIHDHADAHCCVKMLAGELIEHLYDFPEHEGEKLQCRQETSMKRNEVGYINDSIGLHRMSNPLKDQVSVSLHLYTPPYASMYGCSMYEASNGRKHHVDMSKYYSWQGKLINEKESLTC